MKETLKWVALPGYSEHGNPKRQAIDVGPKVWPAGIKQKKGLQREFVKTPEYKWMLKNANKYNFYLSYPKGNPSRTGFEPWHWHYQL